MSLRSGRHSRQSFTTPPASGRAGFTLTELLVVIGILTVLIGMVVPALMAARKYADRVRCLSNMRQLGLATVLYRNDNAGFWPPTSHAWGTGGPLATRRWFDFLSNYVVGDVIVDVGGTPMPGNLNPAGSGDAMSEPQIGSDEIRWGNNALWGCPSWRRINYIGSMPFYNNSLSPGYGWSRYFCAPNDWNDARTAVDAKHQNVVLTTPTSTLGRYTRGGYRDPSRRALLMDSVFFSIQTVGVTGMRWKYRPEGIVPFPTRPDTNLFSIDFDRHGKRPAGNGPLDVSLNILYADGHAAPGSARDAWRAMRFE